METPYISIIIVCYNYSHLLPKALNAISRQSFRDFEVIFVDNGSSDDSRSVAEDFFEKHQEIRNSIVIVEKNIGPAHGDNMGVHAAKGKYLLFNDADDWMDDDCLELLAMAAKSNNADRVIGSFRDVDQNGKVLQKQVVSNAWINTMQQANLFKRSVYLQNGIVLKDRLWLDADKTLRFNAVSNAFSYVEKDCYNYLVHTDSTSRSKDLSNRIWSDERYSFELFVRNLKYEVGDYLSNQEAKDLFNYQMVRLYYSYIYQFLRNASLAVTIASYTKLNKIMNIYFPNYINNKYIVLHPHLGLRLYSRVIVWGSAFFEKIHLMKLALIIYHFFSKFVYFYI